jgi:hypothetical protein
MTVGGHAWPDSRLAFLFSLALDDPMTRTTSPALALHPQQPSSVSIDFSSPPPNTHFSPSGPNHNAAVSRRGLIFSLLDKPQLISGIPAVVLCLTRHSTTQRACSPIPAWSRPNWPPSMMLQIPPSCPSRLNFLLLTFDPQNTNLIPS